MPYRVIHGLNLRAGVALLALLSVLAFAASHLKAQPDFSTDERAIREVLSSQQLAWNHADIAAFLEGYWRSPELTFAGSDGIVRGYDGLMQRYQRSFPTAEAMGQLDFSGLEFHSVGPDSVLVLGHWHLKRSTGDAGGVFTLVFRRFPEGWRIIHDHTSAQKQTP